MANFLASGLLRLGRKLGPLLWQFPPSMKFDGGLLEAFFASLPHDTEAAVARAKRHDDRIKQPLAGTDGKRAYRHAVEIRHMPWVTGSGLRRWVKGQEPNDAERVSGPARNHLAGRDVFMYFDNDIRVKAPENAADLAERLRLT